MKTIEEGKTSYIELNYYDRTRLPMTPTGIRYRIDDLSSGAQIAGWANVSSPSATSVITITAAQNYMHSSSNTTEIRVVTIEATFTGSIIVTKEVRYSLLNLHFYAPPA
jgi:hypothetical protein